MASALFSVAHYSVRAHVSYGHHGDRNKKLYVKYIFRESVCRNDLVCCKLTCHQCHNSRKSALVPPLVFLPLMPP